MFEQPGQQDGFRGGFVTPGIFLHQGGRLSDVFWLTIQAVKAPWASELQAWSRTGFTGNIPSFPPSRRGRFSLELSYQA